MFIRVLQEVFEGSIRAKVRGLRLGFFRQGVYRVGAKAFGLGSFGVWLEFRVSGFEARGSVIQCPTDVWFNESP